MFVDREEELAWLRERYARDAVDLFVVYGRRCIGRSTLLRESLRDVVEALQLGPGGPREPPREPRRSR